MVVFYKGRINKLFMNYNEMLEVLKELKDKILELPNGLEAMGELLEGSSGLRDSVIGYLLGKASIEEIKKGLEG
jgi:hypothetical protein